MAEYSTVERESGLFLFLCHARKCPCPAPHSPHHTCAIDSDYLSLLDQFLQLEQKVTKHKQSCMWYLEVIQMAREIPPLLETVRRVDTGV